MSCNCNPHHQKHSSATYPYNCDQVNRMFDPNPPAYYGTWNNTHKFNTTNRVAMTQPGVCTGLYHHDGPLHCDHCGKITTLLGVSTTAKIILTLNFDYTGDTTYSIDIEPGKIYTIQYVEDGVLLTKTGIVVDIYKVDGINDINSPYKIKLDCSKNYTNDIAIINTYNIRAAKEYSEKEEINLELKNIIHLDSTIVANKIVETELTNVVFKDDRIVSAKIKKGILINSTNNHGIIKAVNNDQKEITLIHSKSFNGLVVSGTIKNANMLDIKIEGAINDDNGTLVEAIKLVGTITNVVIENANIVDPRVETSDIDINNIIEPVIYDAIVSDAVISGEDMVTIGGITIDNITTGGTTYGGIANGGVSIGNINNEPFTIIDGVTKYEKSYNDNYRNISNCGFINNPSSDCNCKRDHSKGMSIHGNLIDIKDENEFKDKLITTNTTVVGGKIIGGVKKGNIIYNAIIKGGIASNGITLNGVTREGTLLEGIKKNNYLDKLIISEEKRNNNNGRVYIDQNQARIPI